MFKLIRALALISISVFFSISKYSTGSPQLKIGYLAPIQSYNRPPQKLLLTCSEGRPSRNSMTAVWVFGNQLHMYCFICSFTTVT